MPEIEPVSPASRQWPAFIALYGEYLQRYWPEAFGQASQQDLAQANDTLLRARWQQDERGLFLLRNQQTPIGLANVWLDRKLCVPTLQIAEFYIRPARQRQGLGRLLWQTVLQWGQEHGAGHVRAQTDADKPAASAFWQALGLHRLSTTGNRIDYEADLSTLKIAPTSPKPVIRPR